ncbi:hypothetical protein TNCT_609271 [Trichonephila clavata]|uniref:Uncharacterized protein n=1 Tax=Trichonephila clavata TaxID=2740835 RepID=A0A8X6GKP7_TRICU|nr:hypothetical protein TNCT_609271 [Trichonephila clavata]
MSGIGPLKLHPPSKWMKWTRHRRVDHARWTLGEEIRVRAWNGMFPQRCVTFHHYNVIELYRRRERDKCFLNMSKEMKTTIHDFFILSLLLKVGKYF